MSGVRQEAPLESWLLLRLGRSPLVVDPRYSYAVTRERLILLVLQWDGNFKNSGISKLRSLKVPKMKVLNWDFRGTWKLPPSPCGSQPAREPLCAGTCFALCSHGLTEMMCQCCKHHVNAAFCRCGVGLQKSGGQGDLPEPG